MDSQAPGSSIVMLAETDREDRLRFETVAIILRQAGWISFGSLCLSVLLAVTFWSTGHHVWFVCLVVAIALLNAFTCRSRLYWLSGGIRTMTEAHLRPRTLVILAHAIAWGSVPFWIGWDLPPSGQISLLALAGIVISANIMIAPMVRSALASVLLVAVAFEISRLLDGHAAPHPEMLFCAVFVLLTMGMIVRQHAIIRLRTTTQLLRDEQAQLIGLLLKDFEEHGSDWLWYLDSGWRLRRVSNRFAAVTGRAVASLAGVAVMDLMVPERVYPEIGRPDRMRFAAALFAHETFRDLRIAIRVGQGIRWLALTGTPVFDEKGGFDGFRGVGSDVTAEQESQDRVRWLASHDALTGLCNRHAFRDTLNGVCVGGTSFAVHYLDLDGFKLINDAHGHAAGDTLLQAVADRMRAVAGDATLARLGGDEFALLQPEADRAAAEDLAGRLLAVLCQPYRLESARVFIGASIGIAVADGSSAEALLAGADLALYRSKQHSAKKAHVFENAMTETARKQRLMQLDLASAIADGKLFVEYQPIVDAITERMVGAEALVRWTHADWGAVPPSEFIPIAERSGLILPLGRWVLRRACRLAAGWPPPMRVTVNLSPVQLQDAALPDVLREVLAETGLAPHRLELEITETAYLGTSTPVIAMLHALRAQGVRIALDDFGVGYASLSALRAFRFDKVKIDRSFVQMLGVERDSQAIVQAVIGMAASLGMRTIAEGVETPDQQEMLRAMGCTSMQGFLFGRPCAPEAIAERLRTDAADVAPTP